MVTIQKVGSANTKNNNTGSIWLSNHVEIWFGDKFPIKTQGAALLVAIQIIDALNAKDHV